MAVVLASLSASAFAPVPKESAKALQVTRGRPFSSGAVFINGKYLEPPYVVERWGTGIRINGRSVSGQVIDWNEFLKTQAGVKVAMPETPAAAPAPEPAPVANEDVSASSLDDLFDDDPKPTKKAPAVSRSTPSVKAAPVCSLTGEFVPNDMTKAMLARINARRTEIDRTLRAGGFICFGDTYSQVSGDSRMLLSLLQKLPEFQRNARNEQDFCGRVRNAGMVYLNEVLCMDLYRNRIDYRKLLELRAKLQKDSDMQRMLDEVSAPLF